MMWIPKSLEPENAEAGERRVEVLTCLQSENPNSTAACWEMTKTKEVVYSKYGTTVGRTITSLEFYKTLN